MQLPCRFRSVLASGLAAFMILNVPAYAHNENVHSGMVDLSYEIMKAVENNSFIIAQPPNANQADWLQYINAVHAAPARYRKWQAGLPAPNQNLCNNPLNGSNDPGMGWWQGAMGDLKQPVNPKYNRTNDCGVWPGWTPGGIFAPLNNSRDGHPDYTGTALGFWTANVDAAYGDQHLWLRPTSMAGAGALNTVVNDGLNFSFAILLLPFVCLADLLEGHPGTCWADAKDAGDALNPLDDLTGALPGFGDLSGDDYTGMSHHIQMLGGGENDYDDHQGLFLSHAGPFATLDQVDLAAMTASDLLGISINYDASDSPKFYESKGGDGLPATLHRSRSQWQYTTAAHTPMEPVDNLAQWGWNNYFDPNGKHPVEALGFPLHALGDAMVPMHAAGTPSWGHRPYEDGMDRAWTRLRLEDATSQEQVILLRDIVYKGFEYFMFIKQWQGAQAAQNMTQIPIRQLVTIVASHTASYSMQTQASKKWPFDGDFSEFYKFENSEHKEFAISAYANFPNVVDLHYPILVDGVGALVAFMTSASEVIK
jgi:hypothetical protein